MKKLFLLLSALVPMLSYAYDFIVDGIYYIIASSENNEVSVTYSSTDGGTYSGSIVIPSEVTYSDKSYKVTRIGEGAFYVCAGLDSIEIPNSVTNIGDNAFSGCTGLPVIDGIRYADTYIVNTIDKNQSKYIIKEGTRFIGSSAFSDCTGLDSIEIPNSVTSIGSSAFSECG